MLRASPSRRCSRRRSPFTTASPRGQISAACDPRRVDLPLNFPDSCQPAVAASADAAYMLAINNRRRVPIRRPFRAPPTVKEGPRINEEIRLPEVQLVDHEGLNRGVVPIEEARELAEEAGLDL